MDTTKRSTYSFEFFSKPQSLRITLKGNKLRIGVLGLGPTLQIFSKVRINNFIDEYKVLPANCYTYSAGKSMSACINDLLLHISIAKGRSQQVLAVMLDVKNSYEKAVKIGARPPNVYKQRIISLLTNSLDWAYQLIEPNPDEYPLSQAKLIKVNNHSCPVHHLVKQGDNEDLFEQRSFELYYPENRKGRQAD